MSLWRALAAGELDIAAARQAAADFSMSGAVAGLEQAERVLSVALPVVVMVLAAWFAWQTARALARRTRRGRASARAGVNPFAASCTNGHQRISSQRMRICTLGLFLVLLWGCGGGGGAGTNAPAPGAQQPPATQAAPSDDELKAASRFLSRATFGAPLEEIEEVARMGPQAWLDRQRFVPPGSHAEVAIDVLARLQRGELSGFEPDGRIRRWAWWQRTLTAPDQLRQRVAFALSEIFVVSDHADALGAHPFALAVYYDVLLANALGNYRDLLRDVALSPAMGVYLSHLNNRRSDPVRNTFPDENFAREVMQLFSIGLFELAPDGEPLKDDQGQPIPTYDADDIREFAKIFTGLSYGGDNTEFDGEPDFGAPMRMYDAFHEPGEKRLLRGLVVPSGQSGEADLEAALDNLFMHPNVGPFIGRRLIQRLVTSNPSPDYVRRVAAVFDDDGTCTRGNLFAVVKAILLDPEALALPDPEGTGGKLREPLLRYIAMLRQLGVTSSDGFFANNGFLVEFLLQQHPLSAPSVFNFFLPDHSPAGALADARLVAPEFQITTTNTIVNVTNLVDLVINGGVVMDTQEGFGEVSLDLSDYVALADDIDALIERLDLVFTYGTLSDETRSVLREAAGQIQDLRFRTQTALYLLLVSDDYAVQL